jgi:hypothetical protein
MRKRKLPAKMKVIFLDIDGVLNRTSFVWIDEDNPIDPKSAELLNELLLQTGAKIVVSSSWRLTVGPNRWNSFESYEAFFGMLRKSGVHGEFIGVTVNFNDENKCRGDEILDWLKSMKKGVLSSKRTEPKRWSELGSCEALYFGNEEMAEVESYVILDDNIDAHMPSQNTVETDSSKGLTKKDVERAVHILLTKTESSFC